MKKYILSALLFAAIGSFSCNNPDNKTINNTDSVRGNTDSAGSSLFILFPRQQMKDTQQTPLCR